MALTDGYGSIFSRLRQQQRPFSNAGQFLDMTTAARAPLQTTLPAPDHQPTSLFSGVGASPSAMTAPAGGGFFANAFNKLKNPDPYSGEFGLFFKMLDDAQKSGVFDPNGAQGLLDSIRRRGISDAGALERGAVLRAQAAGLSPESVNFARLTGGMEGQSQLSSRLGEAELATAMKQQDFIRQLLASLYGSRWAPKPEKDRPHGSISLGPVGVGF